MKNIRRQIPIQIKKAVYIRDSGECQLCGWMKQGEYHHIFEWKNRKEHDIWNIVFLCSECHKLITPNYYKIDLKSAKNSASQDLVDIITDNISIKSKLNKLNNFVKYNCKKSQKTQMKLICKYFKLIVDSKKHRLELNCYKKVNGDVILKWQVTLQE